MLRTWTGFLIGVISVIIISSVVNIGVSYMLDAPFFWRDVTMESLAIMGASLYFYGRLQKGLIRSTRILLTLTCFYAAAEILSTPYLMWISPKPLGWWLLADLSVFFLVMLPLHFFILSNTERRLIMEQVLEEQEQLNRSLFEQNADGVFYVDLNGLFVNVNKAGCELTGYEPEELIGQPFLPFFVDEYKEYTVERFLATKNGEPQRFETAFQQKSGTVTDIVVTSFPTVISCEVVGVYAIVKDVTHQKTVERSLIESESRYRRLVEFIPEAFAVWVQGRITYINQAGLSLLGAQSSDQVLGKHVFEIIRPDYHKLVEQRMTVKPEGEINPLTEMHLVRLDGEIRDIDVVSIHMNYMGESALFAMYRDVTETKAAIAQINHMAYHDELTGLPNRRLLESRLSEAIHRSKLHGHRTALVYVDLDRFKWVNDTLSHEMGDLLLTLVSQRLLSSVHDQDMVARLGGDEFVIIMEQVQDTAQITDTVQTIIERLGLPFQLGDNEMRLSCSIGITIYPDDGPDGETLMKNADAALYRVKEMGKNGYSFFTADLQEKLARKMRLEFGLRRALEQNEFILYYQPQVDANTREMIGVEALIRWEHPELGRISPADFIPVAEETGLIIPIGDWVLREACRQNKRWQDEGFRPIKVGVNLSANQFKQSDLVDKIKLALKETGLDPHYLDLEITESIAMQDVETVIAKLCELRELGVHISIDDFGTGYSSMAYLKRFPIHTIKVAQQFVRDLTTDPDDKVIVASVVAMAKSMKLDVLAEGVETPEQLEFLRQLTCDHIQGYVFSRPLPAVDVPGFFRDFGM